MKFVVTENYELVVIFEKDEKDLGLCFLEGLECQDEKDYDMVTTVINTLEKKPHLRFVQ